MGLFDNFGTAFKGLVNQVDASDLPKFLDAALERSRVGNLQSVVDGFEKNGLADRVRAWMDHKTTATSEDVLKALGPDNVERLSKTVGLTTESTLELLADRLPETIKAASDDGRVTLGRGSFDL